MSGIQVETSQRSPHDTPWHWLTGDTYPHRDLLKRHGARWSKKRQAWYVIGDRLPDAIQQLISEPVVTAPPQDIRMSADLERQILDVLAEDDAQSAAAPETPEPAVRVINPASRIPGSSEHDPVQIAIRETASHPLPTVTPVPAIGRISRIDQEYVGELTGSITGQIHCYGYALHDGICIYLNMAGPRIATEAIRAKLSRGDIVSVVPPDTPSIELTAGEGNTGMYHAWLHYLPEARFASMILVHDWAVNPNYGGKATTFIFRTSDMQATAKLRHHVMQLVNIPVFEAWSGYLYDAGQRAMLVRKCRSEGGIDLLSVDLDVDAWTRLITSGLEQEIICLP